MLFSPAQKFIFIHIYKTGGLSVTHAMHSHLNCVEQGFQKLGRQLDTHRLWDCWKFRAFNLPQHATASEVQAVVAPNIFEACFKFAFVRNPWSLQLSLYRYVLNTPEHHQHALFSALPGFEAYIEWIGTRPGGRHRVQRDFVMDGDGAPLVDFIGRFERLAGDYATVAERFGWPTQLPHLNKSDGDPDFRKFYNPRTRDIVADLHRPDIESFGYEF